MNFGYNRGLPIDRHYIGAALAKYSNYIKGPVLEVGGRIYSEKFSDVDPEDSFILNYVPMAGDNVIVGDLCDYSLEWPSVSDVYMHSDTEFRL